MVFINKMSILHFAHEPDLSGEICIVNVKTGETELSYINDYGDKNPTETFWNTNIIFKPWNPQDNAQHPDWLFYGGKIPSDICDKVLVETSKIPTQDATTFRTGPGGVIEKQSRLTQIRWLTTEYVKNNDTLLDLVRFVFECAKTVNMAFDVDYNSLPSLQITEYLKPGYHYNWHHDIDWARDDGRQRKLSFVIQMTDPVEYDAGNLEFRYIPNPNKEALRRKGTIIFFLPYHEHRVTPIVSGKRTSIVGWFEGPRWK